MPQDDEGQPDPKLRSHADIMEAAEAALRNSRNAHAEYARSLADRKEIDGLQGELEAAKSALRTWRSVAKLRDIQKRIEELADSRKRSANAYPPAPVATAAGPSGAKVARDTAICGISDQYPQWRRKNANIDFGLVCELMDKQSIRPHQDWIGGTWVEALSTPKQRTKIKQYIRTVIEG
jgi:hypothetical protein